MISWLQQMLQVEGPSVSMETFYVDYVKGTATYTIGIILEGTSFLPVTASLSISQRRMTTQGTVRNGLVVYQVTASPQKKSDIVQPLPCTHWQCCHICKSMRCLWRWHSRA